MEHLKNIHPTFGPAFDINKIKISPYKEKDNRIGWVNIQIITQEGWGVIGFTGDLE